jgi:FkbM family methyltransferase
VRKQIMSMVGGGPLEWFAREMYYRCRDIIPASVLPPNVAKGKEYDQLTIKIAAKVLSGRGNSIDIGANAGQILKALVELSPHGAHWAFEPIPRYAAHLRRRYPGVAVRQVALSDRAGTTEFHYLPKDPAYSSLLTRPDIEAGQEVQVLQVETRQLDDCIPDDAPISFIKIDVESSEAAVLRGATRVLRECRPVVVFECEPPNVEECAAICDGVGFEISFLSDFLAGVRRNAAEVAREGRESGELYYVASSR